jgi:hypothetical protein
LKQLLRFPSAILTQDYGFAFALWVAYETFVAQSIQGIPVMTLPGANKSVVPKRCKVKQRKNHFVDFVLVVIHTQYVNPFNASVNELRVGISKAT